jgi:type IV pilus assembly protein PilB
MFRNDFLTLITSSGLLTLKEVKPLTLDRSIDVVSELGLLKYEKFDDIKFAQMLAKKYSLRYLDISHAKVPAEILSLTGRTNISKYRIIPIQKTSKSIILVTYDPSISGLNEELKQIFKFPVELILTHLGAWSKLYEQISYSVDELINTVKEVKPETINDGAIKADDIGEEIILIVNKLLVQAYIKKASDIHIEPYEKKFRVRLRIDGNLHIISEPPMNLMLPIISRIKIMAQMDIAERRIPQDGRIKIFIAGKPMDYRVSSLPTLYGEKIVLRVLDNSNLQLDMTFLGFEKDQLEVFKQGVHKPFGMVLVTGPTGSGKTTTLYSAVHELNAPDTNISTVEDPVEFNFEGVNQVNVKKDIGLTFASSLKSFLRQDPDVIMVGEIRDQETGVIAVEAALTGHLVLSTLHTNDAASTIIRILNMGIEPFLIAGSLNVIVAQRLCRKICNGCREEIKMPDDFLISCGFAQSIIDKVKTYRGAGCNLCNNTGYKGRVAIYEVLNVDMSIRELILRHANADDIKSKAVQNGMKTLRTSALMKVVQGVTTLDEAIANSASDK